MRPVIARLAAAERAYRHGIEQRIAAPDASDDRRTLGLGRVYLPCRWLALRWAVRRGLWIADTLNVAMCLTLEPGDVFLDIGANVGWMTERAAWLVGRRGEVHSFEPSPSATRLLRRRVAWLGLHNVRVNEFGLGAAPGTATLYEFAENFGGASSLRAGAWPGRSGAADGAEAAASPTAEIDNARAICYLCPRRLALYLKVTLLRLCLLNQ